MLCPQPVRGRKRGPGKYLLLRPQERAREGVEATTGGRIGPRAIDKGESVLLGRALEKVAMRRHRCRSVNEIRQFVLNGRLVLGSVGISTGCLEHRWGGYFEIVAEVTLTRAQSGLRTADGSRGCLSTEVAGADGRLFGRGRGRLGGGCHTTTSHDDQDNHEGYG